MNQPATPDLIITGGRVIDPASGFDAIADVAITGNTITAVGPDLSCHPIQQIIDATGLIVVPGLIDCHAHVFTGMGLSADVDLVGVLSGVTTIVDAGTAGPCTWDLFHRHVINTATTRTLAFLHIGRTGQAFLPELRIEDDIDLAATIRVAQSHPDVILGIKLRAVGAAVHTLGNRMVDLTKQAARASGGLQMIHIGDPGAGPDGPVLTKHVVESLDPGDILAHIFTDQPGSLIDANGRLMPEVLEAQARGVIMEPSAGRMNFSFDVARQVLDQGLRPAVIGTDITAPGRGMLVYSLTEIMSQFLALGFTVPDVIRMTTAAPAQVFGLSDTIGALAPGREADITLLRQESGNYNFTDLRGATLHGDTALAPVLTLRAGQPITPAWGPHPWGWLPATDPSAS